jgi:hypothetical protein
MREHPEWAFAIGVITTLGVIFAILFATHQLSFAASNEHLGDRAHDRVDTLIEAGRTDYCGMVAEYWDDGTWAASIGIADAIITRPDDFITPDDPADLPRDGIRRFKESDDLTEHEQGWYADLFHAGWKAGSEFMLEHPEVLIDRRDTGRIPLGFRAELKQGRFEQCLREWPPRET